MKKLLTALVLIGSLTPTLAGVDVIDGDTIHVDGIAIRILDIDTPETWRSRCDNEYRLGVKAKERLEKLIADNGGWAKLTYTAEGTDRYGRTLGHVKAGTVDVSAVLLKEGYALRYKKGGEAKLARLKVWCGPAANLDY